MRIVAHSDHAGVAIRHEMIEQARELGHEVDDLGPAEGEKVDYPYAGALVGHKVAAGEYDLGLLVCGTGEEEQQLARSLLVWPEDKAVFDALRDDAPAVVTAFGLELLADADAGFSVDRDPR